MNSREKGKVATMDKEIWKPIKGYEGLYEVSNYGMVKGIVRSGSTGRQRKFSIDPRGYLTVQLYKNGKCENFKVHRLVALAFIENPEGKRTVNHKDGNKKNNCVDNLEWMTHGENHRHAYRTGLKKVTEKQRQASRETGKRTCELNRPRKAVIMISDNGEKWFESAHAGARYVEGGASPIVRCCKGKKKTYKGMRWVYAD